MNTMQKAINKVKEYYTAKNMPFNEGVVKNQVEDWYWNTDVAEPTILAGCVIEYGFYDCQYTYGDMINTSILFFETMGGVGGGHEPYEQEIGIDEIEEAMRY